MNVVLKQIPTLTPIPVVATTFGGPGACFRTPNDQLRSLVQHFAAGVGFAAVAGELLPEIPKEHQPVREIIDFSLGVTLMLVIRHFAKRLEGTPPEQPSRPSRPIVGLTMVVGPDAWIDGLMIGVGWAVGARVGTLLVTALTLELFPGCINGRQQEMPWRQRVETVADLSLLIISGATLGGTLLHGPSGLAPEITLSFSAAALPFLVTEELLNEADEVSETPLTTTAFFAGFIALLELAS